MTSNARMMDGPGRTTTDSPEFRAVLHRLATRSKLGMVLGLERMQGVLARLGNPEKKFRSIHVVGSNGKGSTSAFLSSILGQRRRVGLYTSPHLVRLNERVQFVSMQDGRIETHEVSDELLAAALLEVEAIDESLTFFEWVTAAAFVVFGRANLDVVVLEAGLGARLDATRTADSELAVITDLSLEHTEILGDTIELIAGEKAAAIRTGRPVVFAGGPGEEVIRSVAAQCKAATFGIGTELRIEGEDFGLPDRTLTSVAIGLAGKHQRRNAILAASAAVLFDPSVSDAELRAGLLGARWPGRLDAYGEGPRVLIDGAHNEQGASILAAELPSFAKGRPVTIVFGALSDKRADLMLERLVPCCDRLLLTRPDNPRAAWPSELLGWTQGKGAVIEDPSDALEHALLSEGLIVVTGSLYLVGQLLPRVREKFRR